MRGVSYLIYLLLIIGVAVFALVFVRTELLNPAVVGHKSVYEPYMIARSHLVATVASSLNSIILQTAQIATSMQLLHGLYGLGLTKYGDPNSCNNLATCDYSWLPVRASIATLNDTLNTIPLILRQAGTSVIDRPIYGIRVWGFFGSLGKYPELLNYTDDLDLGNAMDYVTIGDNWPILDRADACRFSTEDVERIGGVVFVGAWINPNNMYDIPDGWTSLLTIDITEPPPGKALDPCANLLLMCNAKQSYTMFIIMINDTLLSKVVDEASKVVKKGKGTVLINGEELGNAIFALP